MEEKQILEQLQTEFGTFMSKAKEEMKSLGSVQSETNAKLEGLRGEINAMLAYQQKPAAGAEEVKTFGQRFIEDAQVQEFGKIWRKSTVGMRIDGQPLMERKTTITSGTVGSSTPGILVPERVGGIIKPPQRRLRVRDIIPFGTTTSNAVEYVKENAFTNAGSPISEGSAKPESALTFTIASANVRTIASWIPASKQVLEDWAVLQSYIDTRLLEGLADIEDHELLRGDNTDQHLNGIITQATAFAGTYSAASDTYIDQLSAAMMELEAANYAPDAVVVHPVDWRRILKIKTEDGGTNKGAYIMGGPASDAQARLWDLNVVPTTAMVTGTFLVGQFAGSVQGFDRMQSSISVSTEHSDYFTKNLVAIRAEQRITLACFRPAAFRYGSFA